MSTRSTLAVRLAALSALLLLIASQLSAEDKPSPRETRAEAELKRLTDGGSSEASQYRQKLHAFRLAHPGTQAAVKAATLFGELPAPLDKLDSKTIPEIEKFDWQPKELVGLLGEHRGRHGGTVSGVAFSHDGKLLASVGGNYVRLWNPEKMRLIGLAGHAAVICLAFAKDDSFLITGSAYGSVCVWDLPKGAAPRLRHSIAVCSSAVYAVSCHHDNKIFACACFDNQARQYDISGAKPQEFGQITAHNKPVRSVAYSNDGKSLATASEDQTCRIWDTTDPREPKQKSLLEGHATAVTALAWTRGGKTLATGCTDGSVRLWTMPASAKPKAPFSAHQGPKNGAVTALAFDHTGNTLAVAHSDKFGYLLNVSTRLIKEKPKLEGHQDPVHAIAFNPRSSLVATGGDDWTVRTWDMSKSRPAERFVPWSHLSHVYSAAFSSDGTSVASGSYDRVVRVWDLDKAELKTRRFLKFENRVYAVAYSPDGKLVAAGGEGGVIKQWDANKLGTKPACKDLPSHVYQILYSPDSKQLLAQSGTDLIVYDAVRGAEHKRHSHKTNVTSIALAPDGKRAVSTSGNYLYQDGKIVIRNDKYVYTDCVLKMWDMDTGEEAAAAKEAKTPYYGAGFSADGKTLYGGNYEPLLRRWGVAKEKLTELEAWKATSGYPAATLATPDGKHLLTRGLDSTLVLWDAASGKQLRHWAFNEQIGGVAVSGDGRHVAVGLGTGVVYVLRIAEAKGK